MQQDGCSGRFSLLSELQAGAGSAWQDLAATYTEQTGVPVTVITAADGTYEQTLKSEIAKPKLLPYSR